MSKLEKLQADDSKTPFETLTRGVLKVSKEDLDNKKESARDKIEEFVVH